ncbi:MAG: response regulator transcription factor [Gammaproteobacteria bacterium]|nr:response regulator transcription factor [Gammaproteobacteria bacterium]
MSTPLPQLAKNTVHDVLLVEDDDTLRQRLASILSTQPELNVIATVATLQAAKTAFFTYRPRLVVTDLGLPDGSGVELIKVITASDCMTDCMVISVFSDQKHVIEALRAGAKGYLLKDSDSASITENIQSVLDGGSPIDPKVACYLLDLLGKDKTTDEQNTAGDTSLSEREREILRMVAHGFKRVEIARELHISLNTVSTHIRKIYSKLAIHNKIEALHAASRLGIN